MKIKPEYDLKYDELMGKMTGAKKAGCSTKVNLYEEAGFGIGVIKDGDGTYTPVLASDHVEPLETPERAVKSGVYLMIMALAANGMDEVLDHPGFEKCVVDALSKTSLFVKYAEFMEEIRESDAAGDPGN